MDQSRLPADLRTLVEGVEDASSPEQRRIFFLRRLPRDPFFPDPRRPRKITWGLRSYASPPDIAAAGRRRIRRVFFFQGRGLNGIPYRDW